MQAEQKVRLGISICLLGEKVRYDGGRKLDRYRQEYVPLVVPITLVGHYVRKYDQPYLKIQHYLNPHPLELKLRNHV